MIDFWSSVFALPKHFYAKIDSLCSAFLWKNKLQLQKEQELLGLIFESRKQKKDWILDVLRILSRKSFCLTNDANRFSPAIRSMLQLKHMLGQFLRCEIGDGKVTSFWFDYWSDLGPRIYFIGDRGPRQLKISLEESWCLPAARSDEALTLHIQLTTVLPPFESRGEDTYLWRNAAGTYVSNFSSKSTWDLIRDRSPLVSLTKVVWFLKEEIPVVPLLLGWLCYQDFQQVLGLEDGALTCRICVCCVLRSKSHIAIFFFNVNSLRSFGTVSLLCLVFVSGWIYNRLLLLSQMIGTLLVHVKVLLSSCFFKSVFTCFGKSVIAVSSSPHPRHW